MDRVITWLLVPLVAAFRKVHLDLVEDLAARAPQLMDLMRIIGQLCSYFVHISDCLCLMLCLAQSNFFNWSALTVAALLVV